MGSVDAEGEIAPGGPVRYRRLIALGVLLVGLLLAGHFTGLTAYLSPLRIRTGIEAAGAWGPLLFIGAFSLGGLVRVPGMVFIAAAVVAYGRLAGGALAFVSEMVSLSVSFAVARGVGGKPLGALRWRWARRLLAKLDERPVRTIFLLRLFLWMTPQLNYALALSNVRYRSYLLGSALGLAAPIAGIVLLADRFFN